MTEAAKLSLSGGRFVPFVKTLAVLGLNLTGATFAAQWRDRRDGGFVRATLGTVTSEVEGIRLVDVITVDADLSAALTAVGLPIDVGEPISRIRIRMTDATMTAMDVAADSGLPGEDGTLFWDMHVTVPGGDTTLFFKGKTIIEAGATE